MIKLSDGGVYLLNGTEVVEEKNAPASLNKTEAQKGTISWSILNAHNTSGDMSQLKLKFDASPLTTSPLSVLYRRQKLPA